MYKFILIVLLLIVILYFHTGKVEKFDYNTECSDCKFKSYHQCRNCLNCGVCVDELGNMTCEPGNHIGPYTKTGCIKWEYGNIYPQYDKHYYDEQPELKQQNVSGSDARFYPFLKTLDETKNTKLFTNEYNETIYKRKNTELKAQYKNELVERVKLSNTINDINTLVNSNNTEKLKTYLNTQLANGSVNIDQVKNIMNENLKTIQIQHNKEKVAHIMKDIDKKYGKIKSDLVNKVKTESKFTKKYNKIKSDIVNKVNSVIKSQPKINTIKSDIVNKTKTSNNNISKKYNSLKSDISNKYTKLKSDISNKFSKK